MAIDSHPWPHAVVADLNNSYFRQAGDQLGVTATNDFIYGSPQTALRQQLFAGIGQVAEAIPLSTLPEYPSVSADPTRAELLDSRGLPATTPTPPTDDDLRDMLKLEAPRAVQSRALLPGFFAFNKFSDVPLLAEAARAAWFESAGDDANKRLMLVPRCHVTRLATAPIGAKWRVTGVETNLGTILLPANARVVLAMATIENTQMALVSFAGLGIPNDHLIGTNLQVHLRSNLTIRISRVSLEGLAPEVHALQAGALFLKGRHLVNGVVRHFHLQITAFGLGALDTDAEAKLNKLVPDIDTIDSFRTASDDHVIIAMRGVAEMETPNPEAQIRLASEVDEFGVPRAFVTITPTAGDALMWDALDAAADQVARVFAGDHSMDTLARVRDGLGTTYHEAGTLWLGDDAHCSVTNADARFHAVDNVYVTGPALFPTTGSPNPMLAGVALARRLADHLV